MKSDIELATRESPAPGSDHPSDPARKMRLYLINPSNPAVSIVKLGESRWNRYRVWKPLGLMVIAGLTPDDWEIRIIDENLETPDYAAMPTPDLVGITAFTSQAARAYELAFRFRQDGARVVIGGIHATMRREEASMHADAVVTGEAERVWGDVLHDARHNCLKPSYEGGFADMGETPPARHDLLQGKYAFGAIQTTRGCPLRCSFCSVTSFNGARFRQRPIEQVIGEFRRVPEKLVLIVDDNLVGTRRVHLERAKDLFKAMIRANLNKKWIAQATINIANDDELLSLAAQAGCKGLFIGLESPNPEGAKELGGKHKLCKCSDLKEAVGRIQRHGILVAGSFIIGLDHDKPGIGDLIAKTAGFIGVDFINVLFLTPLPGTQLWDTMAAQNRIALDMFPKDWRYFTLTHPTARYTGLSVAEAIDEMDSCSRRFYSIPKIILRLWRNVRQGQNALIGFVGNLSYRKNARLDRTRLADFQSLLDARHAARLPSQTSVNPGIQKGVPNV